MKKLLLTTISLLGTLGLYSQVTLDECQSLAQENYPVIRRYDLLAQSEQYKLSEIGKGWIPQGSIGGKSSYQSTVTTMPISIPGVEIPSINKLQYQATVDVNQVIWDGGVMSAARDGVKASTEVERQSLDVDMYALRDRVNQLYFGVLQASEQLQVNKLYIDNLAENLKKVEAMMHNGVSSQADVDAVQVGIVQARQDRVNLTYSRNIYVQMLSLMVGRELKSSDLVAPMDTRIDTATNNRPELYLFDAQIASNHTRMKSLNASLMPQLSAYFQGGMGNPGLNMFSDKLGTWALGGVRLSWNFGAFYTKKDKKTLISIDEKNIVNKRDVFLYNLNLQKNQQVELIESYKAAMRDDDQIIALRESVERASFAKMEQGVIGATDFMRDALSTQIARQNKVVRQMQMLMEIYKLKNILNN